MLIFSFTMHEKLKKKVNSPQVLKIVERERFNILIVRGTICILRKIPAGN